MTMKRVIRVWALVSASLACSSVALWALEFGWWTIRRTPWIWGVDPLYPFEFALALMALPWTVLKIVEETQRLYGAKKGRYE